MNDAHTLSLDQFQASAGAAAAIRAQQEQQARLVGMMAAERQFTTAVALMRSVVQLSGLAD